MNFVSARRGHRQQLAMGSALIALAFVVVLALAARAQAAETIYWDNFDNEGPTNVAFANIDGTGGGILDASGRVIAAPEGMAYDTVTNRLFVANEGTSTGEITAIDLGAGGASAFTAPGAPIEEPEGIAVDPATRTIYWENVAGGGSIAWAKLDGSAGGVLNTAGVTLNGPCCRIALDPAGGRVYFVNNGTIAYVNVNNSGGGELNLTGSTVKPGGDGLVVDDTAGRLYFLNESGEIGYANLNGSGGGDVPTGSAVFNAPWGFALDPSSGRLYWGNENNAEERANAIGVVGTNGLGGGGINIATAPVNHPQDPVILKSPTGTGAPTATRDSKDQSKLNCSTGSWAADYAGSFVYQAPRTFAYQWRRNGEAIGGATAPTYEANSAGQYGCTVTAVNQTGSAAQASLTLNLKAAKLKLTTKKKAHAKAGKVAKFKVKVLNQGDITSGKAKVCVKLPKSAKGALKAPKCKSLGSLKGRGTKSVTLKIKVLPSAGGTYKATFLVKGAPGKAAKTKVVVG
jgi:DNA-binding beta-propeller fold protein YncE